MPYNPFDTQIGDVLKPNDLQNLVKRMVAEGYYVEYKSELQKNEKIGRSIASFANTYGGWYIIGVKTDTHNVAIEVCGFSLSSCHDPISKIRDVVKSHIDPTPIFYPQVISFGEDKVVLVTYIPDGQDTPFVSKDGRIYRRVSDSSDPVPEVNRYIVDKLYENGREIRRHFEEFCCDERSFSQAQDGQAWVNLFLSPYPLGIVEKPNLWRSNSVKELLELSQKPLKVSINESGEVSGNLPFNSAQPTFQSVILRQTQLEYLAFNSLEIELFTDGQAKLFIPLQYLSSLEDRNLGSLTSLQTKLVLNSVLKIDRRASSSYLRFFDMRKLCLVVMNLLLYYQEWLGQESFVSNLKVAVTISNVWRHVPFVDSDEWAEYVQQFGLPVVGRDTIKLPQGRSKSLLMSLDSKELWMGICGILGLGFGLSGELLAHTVSEAVTGASRNSSGKV